MELANLGAPLVSPYSNPVVHFWKLKWNLNMSPYKRKYIYNPSILGIQCEFSGV